MVKILAFDTTNSTLSVAVSSGQKSIAEKNILESNKQAEMLIPLIEDCLKRAGIWYQDLDLIGFTNGPGSFTGIRVGYSCAKALQISTNLPIIAVSSLEAIANNYRSGNYVGKNYQKILVVNDARLDEFFIQQFALVDGEIEAEFEPKMIAVNDVAEFFPKENFLLVGSAKLLIKNNLPNAIISGEEDFIDAKNIALLAQRKFLKNSKTNFDALYIREPKITERKKHQ
ncbi:MAG: putative glycoprotein endopeptidase [Rickettsiaceae bacterium]|jgi:tRNA threonylcarbamoyladenosine biosynthesis protein TsaB|nr:putative glycoprotein endopeptidase [Rickettsiaceae bacterium]